MVYDLEALLKESYEAERAEVPTQHSQRTNDCPHQHLYKQYAQEGWPAELQKHARSCQYCQKALAVFWDILGYHPSEADINDPNFINHIAVERHITWHHCESCAAGIKK